MTDPTKALADAARSLLDGVKDTFLEDAVRVRVLEHALAAYDAAQATDAHADTREGWEWRDEVFRLRKVLQAAKAVVEDAAIGYGVDPRMMGTLRAEVERASKGGAA